jgi:primosomal protein N' (replication factor Y) (superfamily II helicase)
MMYVEVLVASTAFHGNEALTYACESKLDIGTIVQVPLRNKEVLGVVSKNVGQPSFTAKPILNVPSLPPVPIALIELMQWMHNYYPGNLGAIVQHFLPKQLPKKPVEIESPTTVLGTDSLPRLTADQKHVIEAAQGSGTYLLHGETGTGKTRVYLELAQKSLATGKSAIILTPEIGLTSQLTHDFREVFGNRVYLIHSQLTEVTKHRIWVSILKQSEPVIVLGPRSALFSPLKKVGLVVIDESHETAYKQDQAPYYHASRVAAALTQIHHATLILGSATPLVSDYFMAETKQRPILRMTETAAGAHLKPASIEIVDLRDRAKFTKKSYLSDALINAIADSLAKKQQALLFLNRRGTARVIFCEQCGWQASCPHCDLPLIYHGDSHTMRCHSCDFRSSSPVNCPNCNNTSVVFKSIGTKAIVDEVTKLFPESRIMRFDTDNKKHERIEQHYDAIRRGEVDILIGTQTLAKGLDLPKLALVGVVIADTSLYFPDFSAEERTYQLLSQVIGRVGRGHQEGNVILQTYAPDSPLLQAIITKDWQTFYAKEISERKMFLFPPFCYLLKVVCRRASAVSAEKAAKDFVTILEKTKLRIAIEGPAPAFHEKVLNKYQWQLVLKAKDRAELKKVISLLPSGWTYDIDPMNLL